jgi:hypothetical protein
MRRSALTQDTRSPDNGTDLPGWLAATLFFLFCAGLSALTYPCIANPDFSEFQTWMSTMTTNGLVSGYARIADYPPLGDAILYLAGLAAHLLQLPLPAALKLTIDGCQLAASLIIVRRFGSWTLGALLFLLVTPFGALLGYVDCFYLPFIVLGLGALEASQPAMALALFTIATLIKWQPAILCPMIFFYAVTLTPTLQSRIKAMLPASLIVAATLLIFHPGPVWTALSGALSDNLYGGQAFNLNWIITYGLEIGHAARQALTPTHTIHYLMLVYVPPLWPAIAKTLFWVVYVGNFCSFAVHKKHYASFLLALLAAESIQFTFNNGVHENHAFLIMILAFAAYQAGVLNPLYLILTATLAISNILAFYGLAIVSGPTASLGTIILSLLQLLVCVAFTIQSHAANRQNGRIRLFQPA